MPGHHLTVTISDPAIISMICYAGTALRRPQNILSNPMLDLKQQLIELLALIECDICILGMDTVSRFVSSVAIKTLG
jgi:hypothetical protein